MLRWFRLHARAAAMAILVSLVALGGVSAHGADCHDAGCAAAVAHDSSSHGIDAPSSGEAQPLHCILCHWTRTPRPSAEGVLHFPSPLGQGVVFHAEVARAHGSVQCAQPPLRSPPAPTR